MSRGKVLTICSPWIPRSHCVHETVAPLAQIIRKGRHGLLKKEGWELNNPPSPGRPKSHQKTNGCKKDESVPQLAYMIFCGCGAMGIILEEKGASLTCLMCRAKLHSGMPFGDAAWMMEIRSLTGKDRQVSRDRWITWHNFSQISKNQRDRQAWASPPNAECSASFTCKVLRPDELLTLAFEKSSHVCCHLNNHNAPLGRSLYWDQPQGRAKNVQWPFLVRRQLCALQRVLLPIACSGLVLAGTENVAYARDINFAQAWRYGGAIKYIAYTHAGLILISMAFIRSFTLTSCSTP